MAANVYEMFSEQKYQFNRRLMVVAPKIYKELEHLAEFVDNVIKNHSELWDSARYLEMLIDRMGLKELLAQIEREEKQYERR